MHVENITSNAISLDRNGQSMLIQVYEKEINRLNKLLDETRLSELHKEYIINELEKYLIEHIDEYREMEQDAMFEFGLVLDKLKELKENNKDG